MAKNNFGETVRVQKKEVAKLLTCPICNKIFKDPVNITECLHIFCSKCICKKIIEEDLNKCPVCNTDLGCAPLDKLRPDHNWSSIRATIAPSLRKTAKKYEVEVKEDRELEFVAKADRAGRFPSISVPPRRKERSLSSLESTPTKVPNQTVTTPQRVKSNEKKELLSQGFTTPIEKTPQKSAEDRPDGSTFSMSLRKIQQPNYSAMESPKQQRATKGTERTTQRKGKSLEGMNYLLKPLNFLEAAADMTNSPSDGLFPKAMSVFKGSDSGNKSKTNDSVAETESTPLSAPGGARRKNHGQPKKVLAPEKLNVHTQAIFDAAINQHAKKRVAPTWLSLVSSDNQKGNAPLAQLPRPYIMIKNVTLPVSFIQKYLAQKLELDSENEVEISMWGEPLLPSLQLYNLIDLWSKTIPNSEEKVPVMVGDSAKDFLMVLSYARKYSAS